MSDATPRSLDVTEEDLGNGLGGYDEFVPGEYTGQLTNVEDVSANTGNYGWRWTFQVNGLDFTIVTWLKGGGLWKLQELIAAMGGDLKPGSGQTLDPNLYVGSRAGLRIGKDPNQKDDRYKDRLTILRTFPVLDGSGSMFEVPEDF